MSGEFFSVTANNRNVDLNQQQIEKLQSTNVMFLKEAAAARNTADKLKELLGQ